MNTYDKLAIGVAAVAVVAVVGISLLGPRAGGVGGPAVSPSPSASPSPSPGANVWPTGFLEAKRYDATLLGIPFSFELPSAAWQSLRGGTELETGSYPSSSYAWLVFPDEADLDPQISTDPCAGLSKPVGSSMAELATAATTIPGTDAVGPTDVTVGGRPAKLVVLTIHADIPCPVNEFWLYGEPSLYPNSLSSTIRLWYVDVDGKVLSIHTDQAGPNPGLGQEIQQIVDSIQFG